MAGVMIPQIAYFLTWRLLPLRPVRQLRFAFRGREIEMMWLAGAALLVLLLLRFGLNNYRASDISFRRTVQQLAILATVAFVLAFGLELARRPW